MANGIGANNFFPGSLPIFAAPQGGAALNGAGLPPQLQQQFGGFGLGPTVMQGNETMGAGWREAAGGQPGGGGVDGGESVANLSVDQLAKFFGSSADDVKTLGSGQNGLTVQQGRALAGSPETLGVVKDLMGKRTDLKLEDMTERGGTKLTSQMKDPETRAALAARPDLKPKDLQEMQASIRSTFKEPAQADAAYKKALGALGDGGDVKPKEIGEIFSKLAGATGTKEDKGSTAVSMFDTARDLMKSGKSAEDVGHLAKAAGNIGGGEGGSPTNVANAFGQAAKTAQSRPDMKGEEIAAMANSVATRFPGKDPTERMAAFQQGSEMMKSPNMGAKGIDTMLARGQEKGLKGGKLLKSLESQGQALKEGAADVHSLTDKGNKSFDFGKDGNLKREKTNVHSAPDAKGTQLGKEDPKKVTDKPATNADHKAGDRTPEKDRKAGGAETKGGTTATTTTTSTAGSGSAGHSGGGGGAAPAGR